MEYRQSVLVSLIALVLLGSLGCAKVPKEAVQLSYAVGTDIRQLYSIYRKTVVISFEQMRKRGLTVIDDLWTPVYLKTTVDELVKSEKHKRIKAVEYWARKSIRDIDAKRKKFLQSLEKQEKALLADIDEAFSRAIRANAAVTAHLNSVLKVQDLQDEVLESIGLKKLRDKIVEASNSVEGRIKEIREEANAKGESATTSP